MDITGETGETARNTCRCFVLSSSKSLDDLPVLSQCLPNDPALFPAHRPERWQIMFLQEYDGLHPQLCALFCNLTEDTTPLRRISRVSRDHMGIRRPYPTCSPRTCVKLSRSTERHRQRTNPLRSLYSKERGAWLACILGATIAVVNTGLLCPCCRHDGSLSLFKWYHNTYFPKSLGSSRAWSFITCGWNFANPRRIPSVTLFLISPRTAVSSGCICHENDMVSKDIVEEHTEGSDYRQEFCVARACL